MTEEEINLLYELKCKLDAGELTQKEFDDAVAVIRGAKKNTEDTNTSESNQKTAPVKKEYQDKKKGVIIAAIVAAVVMLALGLFLILHNSSTEIMLSGVIRDTIKPSKCMANTVLYDGIRLK